MQRHGRVLGLCSQRAWRLLCMSGGAAEALLHRCGGCYYTEVETAGVRNGQQHAVLSVLVRGGFEGSPVDNACRPAGSSLMQWLWNFAGSGCRECAWAVANLVQAVHVMAIASTAVFLLLRIYAVVVCLCCCPKALGLLLLQVDNGLAGCCSPAGRNGCKNMVNAVGRPCVLHASCPMLAVCRPGF